MDPKLLDVLHRFRVHYADAYRRLCGANAVYAKFLRRFNESPESCMKNLPVVKMASRVHHVVQVILSEIVTCARRGFSAEEDNPVRDLIADTCAAADSFFANEVLRFRRMRLAARFE
jgi:hypothetical protein